MRIFVLTGAGVSAESGLGTFRDADGLWTRYDLREVATPEGFAKDPAKVHAFYNARRANLRGSEPNAAHRALARLEAGLAQRGGAMFLCTQNVDDLHERGGVREVTHMHGELRRVRCQRCGEGRTWDEDLSTATQCMACGRPAGMRPDVVWFGEVPLHLDRIHGELARSERFVAVGTSGSVYPAAGLVAEARGLGIPTCEINLEPSENATLFDQRVYGPASEVLPAWVDDLLASTSVRN